MATTMGSGTTARTFQIRFGQGSDPVSADHVYFTFGDGRLTYDCVRCGSKCCRGHGYHVGSGQEVLSSSAAGRMYVSSSTRLPARPSQACGTGMRSVTFQMVTRLLNTYGPLIWCLAHADDVVVWREGLTQLPNSPRSRPFLTQYVRVLRTLLPSRQRSERRWRMCCAKAAFGTGRSAWRF